MKRVFALASVMVCCAAAQEMRESGPVVNSRPMSYWLRTWVEKTTNVNQRVEAQRAFTQAGTNVIPYLLEQLTAGDALRGHTNSSDPVSVEELRQALEREIAAEAALRYMGMCVTSAIPELTKLLRSTNHGAVKAAAEILSDLGPPGTHVLVSALTYSNTEACDAIPSVLRHMATRNVGTNLLKELPALFDSLETLPMDKAFDCSAAIVQTVVAEFARRLDSTNSNTRYIAAKTLGELGASAQSAISDLEKFRNDRDKDVRNAVNRALSHIRGGR